MSVICTVSIAADISVVEQVEADHPEIMVGIGAAAQAHMIGHRRVVRDGFVMDIDEFADEANYREFIGKAQGFIKEYGDRIGVAAVDTVYTSHGE